jgi:hypothetical protein
MQVVWKPQAMRRNLLSYTVLFLGLGLYLYSVYYRLKFGGNSTTYDVILLLSLFVVLVGALLIGISKAKEQPGKKQEFLKAYGFIIAGFVALLVMALTVTDVISGRVALPILLGIFALVAIGAIVVSLRKIRDGQQGKQQSMSTFYYYLGLIGLVIAVLIVSVGLYSYS